MKTKCKILYIVFVVITNFVANAQSFQLGGQIGLDIANTYYVNRVEYMDKLYYPMISYNVNFVISYKISNVGITCEPGLIQKGAIAKYDDERFRNQINYIQFPLLINYHVTENLYFSIGPELSYMISANIKDEDGKFDNLEFYDTRLELSGIVDISYNIFKNLDIGVRYNHGITNIMKATFVDQYGNELDDSMIFNQYFQLFLKFKK